MNKKEQIQKLRTDGRSYREIEKILGCSRSLIAYHLNKTTKKAILKNQTENRIQKRKDIKNLHGGKCQKCGYDKCLAALQFHHRDASSKKFEISSALGNRISVTKEELDVELSKCDLLCANCHTEFHQLQYE
jgi:5-methylcytosine-specific restriction endonuclease McrA